MKKILVFGGTSFMGLTFVQRLIELNKQKESFKIWILNRGNEKWGVRNSSKRSFFFN